MRPPAPRARYLTPTDMSAPRSPNSPGNYYIRHTEGRRVGVATVTHFGAGMSAVFVRSLDGVKPRVQTDEIRVEFERQDVAWAVALSAFGKALGLNPASLIPEI